MRRKIFLPLLSIVLLGFAVFHVVRAQQQPPKAPPPVDPARNPFKGSVAGGGVVEARSENIAIGSHLAGIVTEVFVNVCDKVMGPNGSSPGTPLFRLDDRNLRAELAVRKANLDAARANLRKLQMMPRPEEVPPLEAKVNEARANLDDARDQFQRAEKLWRTKAASEEDAIHRKYLLAVAESQVAKAEADLRLSKSGAWESDKLIARVSVEQSEALVRQTETELERLIVRAPIDGEVLQRNVRPGEYVGVPPSQALLVIGDVSVLHVRVDVDESDLPRFRSGFKGRATPRGNPGIEIPLKFVRVEPMVVPKKSLTGAGTERVDTRVLQVIYAVESPDVKLFVGQQVDVYLDSGK
jgi:HlyD family secretion protein